MKERLLKFINSEGLSSAKFAEQINVQPSSISHILSGRNKPSFDFITKVLTGFPDLNAEWLILGKGEMLKSQKSPDLFDNENIMLENTANLPSVDTNILNKSPNNSQISDVNDININSQKTKIEKIVTFYADKTFKEYFPKQ